MFAMSAKHLLFPILFCGVISAPMFGHAKVANPQTTEPEQLHLVANKGQVTDQTGKPCENVDFRIGSQRLSMFIGSGQLHYQWSVPVANSRSNESLQKVALYRMDVTLLGANPKAQAIASKQQDFYERYYLPYMDQQGITANAYEKITYKDVYPNIDWVLYVKDNLVEYDFVVRSGGKVSDIKLQYGGATGLNLDAKGRLTATTPRGSITENAPVSYQSNGKPIASRFVLQGHTLSFATAPYSGTLTIDPTLSWSTYYGGNMDEFSRAGNVTGDAAGNVYISGHTSSTANIATTGNFQDTMSVASDAFLVKFNSSGVRQWATYYGGNGSETTFGLACDNTGAIYMSGYTTSTNVMATTGAYQTVAAGQDAFLAKFDTNGARLWGTFYGGSNNEQGLGVACDASNNVYLTGYTQSSSSISSTGSQQATFGGSSDAFIVKFNSAGVRQWATYYGGTAADQGWSVACDTNKNVYLSGYTQSTAGIATTGAHQTTIGGGQDGFLVKFDSTGVRQWGTYYGGTGADRALSTACDKWNNIYITGYTASAAGIASSGAHQTIFGGVADVFLTKFNSAGVRQWGTYYGNIGDDEGNDLTCDALGNIYVTGFTNSPTAIATPGTFKDTLDVQDAFLIKFDTSGTRKWGTYFGGTAVDLGYGVYCSPLSKVYVSGMTASNLNLATSGSHQSIYGGGLYDAFLAKFDDCIANAPTAITGRDTVCRGVANTYIVPVVAGASSYSWILPSGWTGTSATNSISITANTATTTGAVSDTIRVSANFLCGSSLYVTKIVTVSSLPVITPSGTIKVCNGDSVTLTASAGSSYQWLHNGTAITSANTQSYVTHTAGVYTVVVTSASATVGCADTSLTDTVVVHPLPVPVITANGKVLSTGSYPTYQWNHDGTAITGAVANTYTIMITSGVYTVTVTDSNGCTGISAPFDAATLGIGFTHGGSNHNVINIYPNPATGYLHIEAANNEKVNIVLRSIDGQKIGYYEQTALVDMSNLAAGIYLLQITDKQGRYISTEKFIKNTGR